MFGRLRPGNTTRTRCQVLWGSFVVAAFAVLAPQSHTQPAPQAAVWRVVPPDVSPARAARVAQLLNVSGPAVDSGPTFTVAGATRVGPAGHVALLALTGSASAGAGQYALRSQFGTACANGQDDDADGRLDDADRECAGPDDGDESAPGFQLPTLSTRAVLGMRLANDSALIAINIALPALTSATISGRSYRATVQLAAAGPGSINLETGRAQIPLQFDLKITCVGVSCPTGTCRVAVAPTAARTTRPYSQVRGDIGLTAQFQIPAVTQCTGSLNAQALSADIGFPHTNARFEMYGRLSPKPIDTRQSLTLFKSSGALLYGNPAAALPATLANPLPNEAKARSVVRDILGKLDLLPSFYDVHVHSLAPEVARVRVVVQPKLPTILSGNPTTFAPVLGGQIEVELGPQGQIVSLESRWRPAQPLMMVNLRAEANVRADVTRVSGWLPSDVPTFALGPTYWAAPINEEQSHYDLLYAARSTRRAQEPLIPGTDFTPRLTRLSPEPGSQVNGTVPVQLVAGVEAGVPPYGVEWFSGIDAKPIASGFNANVMLAGGVQPLALRVRDARSAGFRVWFNVDVQNVPAGGAAPVWQPVPSNLQVTTPNGTQFALDVPEDGGMPKLGNLSRRNDTYLEALYFEQWRYFLTVQINGVTYTLLSDKCVDHPLPHGGACYGPPAPFAVPSNSGAPAMAVGTEDTTLRKTIVFSNLPGTFTLELNYHMTDIVNAACGGNWKQTIASWATITANRTIDGKCPAIVPQIDWTYAPPTPQGITGDELLRWCEMASGENYDGQIMCGIPPHIIGLIIPSATYPVVDFYASLFTAVVPQSSATRAATALVQDTGSEDRLGQTDGAIDRSVQLPLQGLVMGDLFVDILPMRAERTVSVATPPQTRGSYDNYHSKAKYFGMTQAVDFPGCNNAWFGSTSTDHAPCVHLHESWLSGSTFSKGQTVNWSIVLDKTNERFPRQRPSSLADGEALFTAPDTYTDQMLWHISSAGSTQCQEPGPVNNTGRACQVFTSPIFFTH